ncbi:hypothetical protein BCR33DRAFT_788828 [Rhizoclosmatium globosum]|uniref:Uncharacterized protein n=1 Tax=Rhizoclosmatium globosum TaxID=329046 RepID=A0A1Y2BUZ0_9FUNG|nr:hypothetical protein BCR33DRAFT_788828 [Rhizoclosmatium globosum]|eukprot:ORY38598.1 hypothetical protein BCR33DRAFT_788828 [Rhizoclosmatium globosum]
MTSFQPAAQISTSSSQLLSTEQKQQVYPNLITDFQPPKVKKHTTNSKTSRPAEPFSTSNGPNWAAVVATPVPTPVPPQKANHRWNEAEVGGLLGCVKDEWEAVFSKAQVQMATWNAMLEKIYATVNKENDKSEEDQDVPPTLTGESYKSKWRALLGPVAAFAKTVKGKEGSGSATVPNPAYYDEITSVLGNSSAVKGPYKVLEPKSDTPMTAFAETYNNDAAMNLFAKSLIGESCGSDMLGESDDVMVGDTQHVTNEMDEEAMVQEEKGEKISMAKKKKMKNVVESGDVGKKRKADKPVSGENSGKMAKRKESAAKELERIKDAEPEELPVKQTCKPAKNKKEAASRAGAASLAIQKESQATNMELLRQHGLDQDEKRKELDQSRKDTATHASRENAKFLALLNAIAPPKPPLDG